MTSFEETRKAQKALDRKNHDEYERILDKYEDMPDSKKVDILWDALGWMQNRKDLSYNDCIVFSMGGTIDIVNKHSNEKSTKILDMIILDCETDVKLFEGKELNGKTVGELHGILEAKIQAIAKIVKKSME